MLEEPRSVVGPAIAARRTPHASIVVEEMTPAVCHTADHALSAALAAVLRGALSRKRWLSVLDSASVSVPPGEEPRPGPDYRVRLVPQRRRNQVRFRAELTAAGRSHPSWVEFHKLETAQDVFAAIDDLAATIAGRLDAEVERAEIGRALRRPVEPLGAYDCVFRAVPLIFEMTEDAFTRADRLLLAAHQADPHEPLAYSWRAFWHCFHIGQGWAKDLEAAKAELDWVVRRALELDPKDAVALAVAGHIASVVYHDYGRALGLLERSLRLDPTSAHCWDLSALTLCYTGDAPEGLRRLEASRELWERHPTPYYFRTSACIALMLAGEYERAVELGRQTVRENPNFQAPYRPLIASLGHTDQVEEARAYLTALRRLEPDFSIDWFRANYPPLHGEYRDRYTADLRKAGVPES